MVSSIFPLISKFQGHKAALISAKVPTKTLTAVVAAALVSVIVITTVSAAVHHSSKVAKKVIGMYDIFSF